MTRVGVVHANGRVAERRPCTLGLGLVSREGKKDKWALHGNWGLEVAVVGLCLLGCWPTSLVGYWPMKMGIALGLDLSHYKT